MEHQPLRSTDVRDRNRKLILRILFQEGAMSQSRLVQRTGLKAPTVFRIFSKLESDQYIRPCKGPGEPRSGGSGDRKGRRPSYYCVVPSAAFAVGVDFSTAGAAVVIANFVNEVIHHESVEFASGIHRDEVLSEIERIIRGAMSASPIDPGRLIGIGVGAPGTVNTATGTVEDYDRIDGLAGYSIKDHFGRLFGVPVFVHNNASVIAASEYHYETARQYDSVLAVLVRGGVGAAFVNHGRIFLNGTTTALELGRTSVCAPEAGLPSPAQSLESVVGERPLLQRLRETTSVGSWDEAESRIPEEQLSTALSEPAQILATAVRNLYHILHPEAVLIISRFGKLATVLTDAVASALPEVQAIPITYDPVKACYGATDLVFQSFFFPETSAPVETSD